MQEIDLRDIFQIILKRFWLIILVAIIALGLGAGYTFYLVTPQYEATTTLYVGRSMSSGSSDVESAIYQELVLGDKLVNDYRELVKSRQVAELVIERLNNGIKTTGEISEILEVSSRTNTRVIVISARHKDPSIATNVANLTAEVFSERASAIMEIDNVQILDSAIIPNNPVVPNTMMNLLISGLVGLIIGTGIVFLIEFLDNKIRTPDDVEKLLGLPVLRTILSLDSEKKFNRVKGHYMDEEAQNETQKI